MAWNGWDWAVVVVISGALLALLVVSIGKVAARRRRYLDHPPVTDDMVARHPSSKRPLRRAAPRENDA